VGEEKDLGMEGPFTHVLVKVLKIWILGDRFEKGNPA
jgi:hypothetical protein